MMMRFLGVMVMTPERGLYGGLCGCSVYSCPQESGIKEGGRLLRDGLGRDNFRAPHSAAYTL